MTTSFLGCRHARQRALRDSNVTRIRRFRPGRLALASRRRADSSDQLRSTGSPRPIRLVTRASSHPTRSPTHAPKLKPANKIGRSGNSVAKKLSPVRTSSCSPRPRSCVPSLNPVPRKLNRNTGIPQFVQRFRRLVNDFVVHRAAKHGMGMADDGRRWRLGGCDHSREQSTAWPRAARPDHLERSCDGRLVPFECEPSNLPETISRRKPSGRRRV